MAQAVQQIACLLIFNLWAVQMSEILTYSFFTQMIFASHLIEIRFFLQGHFMFLRNFWAKIAF